MPDRLHFTDSDEANELIAQDPMALLIGFALDQQVTVQKAFSGPLAIHERLGTLDAGDARRGRPRAGLPRAPGDPPLPGVDGQARARPRRRTSATRYDGDAARVWTDAADADELRANIAALPGFGEMKVKALGAVLAKRFDVEPPQELVPWHPTLGDVDSAQALADYQAAKRVHKAEWSKAQGERPAGLPGVGRLVRVLVGSAGFSTVLVVLAERPSDRSQAMVNASCRRVKRALLGCGSTCGSMWS